MLYAILTHNFRIICFEQGKLVPREITNISDLSEVAYLSKITDKYSITNYEKNMWYDFQTHVINRSIPSGHLTLEKANIDIYNIKHDSSYMRVHPGEKNVVDFLVPTPNLWEEFRILTIEELSALMFLVKNEWYLTNSNNTIKVNSNLSNHSQISFGELFIDFNELINAICDNSNQYNNIFLDFTFNIDWKVYKAFLYKPAIIFVLFGQGYTFDQLEVSLKSLAVVGEYSGDVFIVTKEPSKDLQSIIPQSILPRVKIIQMEGNDTLDFISARIPMLCSNLLDTYQPILYSDADIVFDRNINEILSKATTAKQCSAQIEYFHIFQESDHNGGSFFKQDSFDMPKVHGFNSGLLLVPNMKNHKNSFKAAYKSLMNYTTLHGRNLPFADQSILNYVLYKLNDFNPSPISEQTQIGGKPSEFNKFDPNKPKGFVHFWNTAEKNINMKKYLDNYLIKKK
ncbi:unnamed protein product [Commensalibacter communis]|uniref:Uncharacterized protein n=1 Tax=Commensalibacter communis TaxID=2972786 RepID=A0A9W4X9G3_9PROT|nr:glycosyltransferase [Commensalibacter communis]CAI3935459.1 unnamed protein product [Commensalibacter communis]CAI3937407.1 unnamed protein product [Commensalibacter communis]CAI3942758.1 unnamed protein product [Commensalibacter communis]CAI3942913.1 unnamed protein product [Commensalibacter communis]CAI3943752.1 unnamed protein product [Commensalibacter communis]